MRLTVFEYGINVNSKVPVPGFLIQSEDKNLLVDTGFPNEMVGSTTSGGMKVTEDSYVLGQLAQLNLTAKDITHVICTHLDPDHAGAHDLFTEAEFFVQRLHWIAATQVKLPRLQQAQPHWGALGLRYHSLDGDTALFPGIEVLETSGHVPGHQSVLVDLPKTGFVLLAGDAIVDARQLDPTSGFLNPFDVAADEAKKSVEKLAEIQRVRNVKLTIFGHDAANWPQIRTNPEYYD